MQRSSAFAGIVACLVAHAAVAADADMSNGKAEYLDSCAVCHGPDGEGDGPLTDQLMKRPADLTVLSRNNGGAFPYYKVYAVIDGRYAVAGHGDREMPVWGKQFLDEAAPIYGPSGGEIVAEERIHELAGYIQSLQK